MLRPNDVFAGNICGQFPQVPAWRAEGLRATVRGQFRSTHVSGLVQFLFPPRIA